MNAQDKYPRGQCTNCQNLRGGWCIAAKQAQLKHINGRAEIGPDLAGLLQWCPAFKERT